MRIRISPEIKDEVSPQLLEFVEYVLKEEQLGRWNAHIWACRREGICNDDDLVICFGPCEFEGKTRLLFLHEVAHALRSCIDWDDSYWHKDGWSREFDGLCKKYLGIEGQKDLFH